jgi:pimeloyl-ACP methyl ester carboxylesterase
VSARHTITNGRVALALHERKGGAGVPLLLLHALWESSAAWGAEPDAWPGPVFALDFSGHGDSGRVRGGAYYIERFLSDADLALGHLGSAALLGAGLGAWYAVILAGTRAERVPGCLLAPGVGLAGGFAEEDPLDTTPGCPTPEQVADFARSGRACDPYCLSMERDPRPPWFVRPFAQAARRVLLVEDGAPKPPWWEAVRAAGAAPAGADLASGIAALARSVV